MTQLQPAKPARQIPSTARYLGSSQSLAGLRHSGFAAGDRRYSGCVLRADGREGRVRLIACVRVRDLSGDITCGDIGAEMFQTTIIPSTEDGGWAAAMRQAALEADALAERAASAYGVA